MAGYGSDVGFTAWLTENGLVLPEGSADEAVLRQRGSVYIDGTYGARFPGVPTGGYAQERAWPRSGATVYNADIPTNVIPDAVIQASYFAALQEATSPGSLAVSTSLGGGLKRKKIDGLEKEFFAGTGNAVADATLRISSVEGLMAPYLTQPFTSILLV